MSYWIVVVYLLCSVGGLTLVKLGTDYNQFTLSNYFFNLQLSFTTLLGLVLYISSFLMWTILVQKFELSYIQPISMGISYIMIIMASLFIFKETINLNQWIGIGFILIGVILMNTKR